MRKGFVVIVATLFHAVLLNAQQPTPISTVNRGGPMSKLWPMTIWRAGKPACGELKHT